MNVFKKIREKLEELKLIDVNCRYKCKKYDWSVGACDRICNEYLVNRVNEIIDQVAEECNNGWISVNEGLPEELQEVLVWYEYFRYGEYNCMHQTYGIGYHVKGRWSGDVSGRNARCIAWQQLPEQPYQSK